MTIGGLLGPDAMSTFDWPSSLRELTISHCNNLGTQIIESNLGNPLLQVQLRSLTISGTNDFTVRDPQEETDTLFLMGNLVYLNVPVDLLSC